MKDINNIEQTIELFVKGKLSEPALSNFKNLMQADPAIAGEVKLHSLTTQAIKENRMMALKARLDAVNVANVGGNGSASSTFAKYFSLKIAATVVATLGVGVSTYFFTQSQIAAANDSNIATTQNLIQDSITQDISATPKNNDEMLAVADLPVATEITENAKPVIIEKAEKFEPKAKKSIFSSKKSKVSANGEEMLNGKFEDGSEGEIKSQIPQAPSNVPAEDNALHASDVDIKNVQDGKYNYHYMLKESTLFLYGNFDASPYEILEFNEKDTQSFYLYYDQSFFALKKGQTDPIKLRKISDSKLLQNLVDARNKKH
ncbi:MAG: hypothetical protein ACKVOU_03310 [Cytophagales bacterium]